MAAATSSSSSCHSSIYIKDPVLTALSTYASVHTVSCSWSITFGRLMTWRYLITFSWTSAKVEIWLKYPAVKKKKKNTHSCYHCQSWEKKIHLTPDSDRTFMMMIWRKVGFFLQFLRLYYSCVQTNMDLTLNKEIVNKCISFHDIYFSIYNIYFFTVGFFFPLVKRVPRLNTVFKPDTSEMLTHELTHQSSAPTSTN